MQLETSSRDRARPGRIPSVVALSLVASLLTAAALLPVLSGFTGQAEGAGSPATKITDKAKAKPKPKPKPPPKPPKKPPPKPPKKPPKKPPQPPPTPPPTVVSTLRGWYWASTTWACTA